MVLNYKIKTRPLGIRENHFVIHTVSVRYKRSSEITRHIFSVCLLFAFFTEQRTRRQRVDRAKD